MVTTAFTPQMADRGAALLRKLDSAGIRVTAAFWAYFEPADTWRFVVASPEVQSEGPKRVYGRIQQAGIGEANIAGIDLQDISVVPPSDSLVKLLRMAIKTTATDVAGIRFSRNTINGQFIEDAYIYRLT